MKKIIMLLLVFIPQILISQDYEPGQVKFRWWDGTYKYFSADSTYFKQRNFMLGWHWGGSKCMSKALCVKQHDASQWTYVDDLVDSCDVILKPVEYSHGVGPEILNARGLQYEPTLLIDKNNPEKLVKRIGDTTNPVFGFGTRRGRILTNTQDPNFNRLIIDGDSLTNQIILADPWPSNQLSSFGSSSISTSQETRDSFLLNWIYFSINLRRFDSEMNDNNVLKIELPYKMIDSIGISYIRFDSIPTGVISDTFSYAKNRGIYRKNFRAPDKTRYFYITKNMIPPNNKDITISAFFKCDDDTDTTLPIHRGNPKLKDNSRLKGRIDSLKIKITYLGGCPLAIDWVRFETPHTRRYLAGVYDDSMINNIQNDFNKYTTSTLRNKGIRLFRFNTIIEGNVYNWIAEKYFNKLVGNVSTCEVGVMYPNHYEQYVKSPDRWFGMFKIQAFVGAPYSRKRYNQNIPYYVSRHLGIMTGFNGNYDNLPNKSSYETFLHNSQPITYLNNVNDSIYLNYLNNHQWTQSFQSYWERLIYDHYVNPMKKGFQYSNKYWWGQCFILNDWTDIDVASAPGLTDSIASSLCFVYHRPYTGEEARLFPWNCLIMGAKGILYDGPDTDPRSSNMLTRLGDGDTAYYFAYGAGLDTVNSFNFLNNDAIGSDFIKLQNEIKDIDNKIYNFDTIAKYLERPRDRIYVGRKSQRLELKKIHDYIRVIDDTLKNLKLQCWLGKGYKKWYNQHPDSVNYILGNFIDTANIRTKRIGISEYEGTSNYNYQDSSFYDITILKNQNEDSTMKKIFYLAIQNRRTEPLVMEYDTLRFYSTAEFDKYVKEGGYNLRGQFKDSTYWKNLWWKRGGCRELTIPFKYVYPDTTQYALLRITELGYNDSTLNAQPWRKKEYYHLIDTTIGQDKALKVRLLPGDGRILRVEVLPPAEKFAGSLEYSNQRKMVAFPLKKNSSTFYEDSLYYHLVYHKTVAGIMKVFYRRSKLVTMHTTNENIIWEDSSKCISDSVYCFCGTGNNQKRGLNCGYPSLVVRKDSSNNPRVYVVFSCEGDELCKDITLYNLYGAEQIGIAEVSFPAEGDYSTLSIPLGKIKHYANGSDLAQWGTPMINASANYNYVCWSDALRGIGVAYHSLGVNDNCYIDTLYIKRYSSPDIIATHPSLNSYSRIKEGVNENTCALVWREENQYVNSSAHIYYSRLKVNNNTILKDTIRHYNSVQSFNADTTILRLGANYNYSNPVIYRSLEGTNPTKYRDRVAWWSKDPVSNQVICLDGFSYIPSIIHYRSITKLENDSNYISSISKIFNTNKSLKNVDISQGVKWGGAVNLSDSALVLNFNSESVCDGSNPKIWHLLHNYTSFLDTIAKVHNVDTLNYRMSLFGNGKLSHLAARYNVDEDLWKNKRVYRRDDGSIAHILGSSQGFYRGGGEEKPFSFIGFTGYTTQAIYSNVSVDEKYFSYDFDWLYPFVCDTCPRLLRLNNRGQYPDTIPTKWFRLNSNDVSMSIKSFGNDTNVVKVLLERRNDRRQTKVNLSQLSDTDYGKHNVRLLNGRDNEYRLLLIRNSDSVEYSENIVIMPDEDDETFDKSSTNEIIILLNDDIENSKLNLRVFPNPAGNEIFVRTGNQNKKSNITYRLFNNLGSEILSVNGKSNEVLNISTSDLPQGIYFLKAESEFSEFEIKSLIIQR